jgi:RecA/RadA recombinase
MGDLLNDLMKSTGNELASSAEDGFPCSDVTGFIDTGSYALNALLSGSIYGGMADNKVLCLAAPESCYKSMASLGIVSNFLKSIGDSICIYAESESAITSKMVKSRGIDPKRFGILPVKTVEEYRFQTIQAIDNYMKVPEKERKPMIFVLDSLGNLSTKKEMEDTAAGKDVKDMTRAQVIKSTFRVLTLKLGMAHIPMIVVNHLYDVVGSYIPTKDMNGGRALKYVASTIIYISKKKDKDDDSGEVIGNILHCQTYKSRLTRENKGVDIRLSYDSGLDRYYGLLPIAEKYGILKKISTKYELADGTKVFKSAILNNPEKYFTKDILDRIDKACATEFKYGSDLDESETLDAVATNAEKDTSDDGSAEDQSAD